MQVRKTFHRLRDLPLGPEEWDGRNRVLLADLGWAVMRTYNGVRTLNGYRLKPDLDPLVIVSEKYKFVFLGVPEGRHAKLLL